MIEDVFIMTEDGEYVEVEKTEQDEKVFMFLDRKLSAQEWFGTQYSMA